MINKLEKYTFSEIYYAYLNKITRKEKTEDQLITIISWLLGYDKSNIKNYINSSISLKEFIMNAPTLNENAQLIKGTICGVKIENINNEFEKRVRYLDKLVDELSKNKSIEKILRK